MAMLLGGIKNGIQRFQREPAMRNAVLLVLAVVALLIPSLLSSSIGIEGSLKVEVFSLGVAGAMIILYGLTLLYNFRVGDPSLEVLVEEPIDASSEAGEQNYSARWSRRDAIIVLVFATLGVVIMSELLVGAVEPVVLKLGVSEFFLGVILIPIIGNAAEHLVAVNTALHNQMDLSVEIAISSSLQIALFVAPILVFVSLLMKHPLTLVFNQFEWLALVAGVGISALVSFDGESNWLEGIELLVIYAILALAFFLVPA
jgi:Ca2+:H+ antiporter